MMQIHRLILLVSGAFWLTCLPIYLYRTIILSVSNFGHINETLCTQISEIILTDFIVKKNFFAANFICKLWISLVITIMY